MERNVKRDVTIPSEAVVERIDFRKPIPSITVEIANRYRAAVAFRPHEAEILLANTSFPTAASGVCDHPVNLRRSQDVSTLDEEPSKQIRSHGPPRPKEIERALDERLVLGKGECCGYAGICFRLMRRQPKIPVAITMNPVGISEAMVRGLSVNRTDEGRSDKREWFNRPCGVYGHHHMRSPLAKGFLG
ncbi:MAG: hypothetical protein KGH56_02335 [Patescibacteria group bacterium]|nr:hypothetical protein [Patescibacteria group bacterium]